jgi:16S rRNA G527 N7-methylase RsmG
MVESKTRKAVFLREAVRQLELRDVHVETARFEELLARPDLHEAMDLVTIRAVRVESRTLLGLQAFLKPGGLIFWFRGPGGSDVPFALSPPLAFQAAHPLVDGLSSRLVVLRKVR